MTTANTETTTRTEWAVKRTWPDRHTEIEPADSRTLAEYTARGANGNPDNPARAEVVSRQVTVTATEWQVRA